MDAIVLAGDQKRNIKVYGENKGFLLLDDKPVFIHVLKKLLNVKDIDNIYIIGPKNHLDDCLKKYGQELLNTNKIFTIEQKETLLKNVFEGFWQSIPEYKNKTLTQEQIKEKYKEKLALFLSVDIPLFMPEEISYFISKCDSNNYDFFVGLTPENAMKIYYPTETSPGIIMAYLHFKENLYRVSNLYLVKPFKIGRIKYLDRMYDIRYQKKITNVFRFIKYIWDAPNTFKLIKFYINMQFALFFTACKLKNISSFFCKFVSINEVEQELSKLIDSRLKSIGIPFGGLALDIDNEKDFEILKLMFNKWQEKQKEYYKKNI